MKTPLLTPLLYPCRHDDNGDQESVILIFALYFALYLDFQTIVYFQSQFASAPQIWLILRMAS